MGITESATLAFTYDGSLLKSTTWPGGIVGSVEQTYDNFFWLSALTVNAANPVTFNYDDDGYFPSSTGLATFTSQRDLTNGLLSGSTLTGTPNITDSWTYDGFDEPKTYSSLSEATQLSICRIA